MTARHSHSIFRRPLAALAVALAFACCLAFAGGAAKPAAADASQWKISQPHWWDKSNGWRRHDQKHRHWNGNQHRRHFNNGYGCFGNCGRPVIVFNGGGVIVASPGFAAVNQGHFIVNQGHFIVGQPGFVKRRPNLIFERPAFVAKQKAFFKRHPSLQLGKPWKHRSWKHKPGGVRMIAPGMN